MDEVRIARPVGKGMRKRGEKGGAESKTRRALRADFGHRGDGESEEI